MAPNHQLIRGANGYVQNINPVISREHHRRTTHLTGEEPNAIDQLKRREFIGLLAARRFHWPVAASAQYPNRTPIVGVLWHAASAEEEENVYLSVLQKAFEELGYIEGKNVQFEHRYPAERPERFRRFACGVGDVRAGGTQAPVASGSSEGWRDSLRN
jgi:hypothetical protein